MHKLRPHLLLAIACVGVLSGCANRPVWLPEEVARAARSDWHKLGNHPITWPGMSQPLAKGSQACELWFTQNRVMTQDGVNDAVAYRRCPNVPDGYYHVGQRLNARPMLGDTGLLPPTRPSN